MQTEDQLHSQLVGDCVLSFVSGIIAIIRWEEAPEAWTRHGNGNPIAVRQFRLLLCISILWCFTLLTACHCNCATV